MFITLVAYAQIKSIPVQVIVVFGYNHIENIGIHQEKKQEERNISIINEHIVDVST